MTDSLPELTCRNQHIFATIVKNYLESGSPVGSGLIAAHPDIDLSSASVRAIMADLEQTGLLFSPHPSAGRIPTRAGLRLFVDGLIEVGGALSEAEHASIDGLAAPQGFSVKQLLDKASMALSGLSKCASLVLAPTEDLCVTHIEFVPLQDKRLLVILVFTNGQVENRMFNLPDGLPASAMIEASNYMNAHYLENHYLRLKTPFSRIFCRGVKSWMFWRPGLLSVALRVGQMERAVMMHLLFFMARQICLVMLKPLRMCPSLSCFLTAWKCIDMPAS